MYDSQYFIPPKYKPQVPNPAFECMTDIDSYWAAKIIMSFTNEQLKAIVHTGQYSDPEAEACLLQLLIERRDKIGAYYFHKVAPLYEFKIDDIDNNLVFSDLAVKTGIAEKINSEYSYCVKCNDIPIIESKKINNKNSIPFTKISKFENIKLKTDQLHWEVKITVQRNDWSKYVKVYLQSDENLANMQIIGIIR